MKESPVPRRYQLGISSIPPLDDDSDDSADEPHCGTDEPDPDSGE
ncbi:hypothetical protein [Haloarcula saliterrae]|nr:hypothetical protein [Haloarcula sp. S1CR25-12]